MNRKRAIVFYALLVGMPASYVGWCTRPFLLPPRIVLNPSRIQDSNIPGSDDQTRAAAMPVITDWVRRAEKYRPEVYGAEKFTLEAFWRYLKNPYLQPRAFTVDGLGPSLSVAAKGESASFQLVNGQWEWVGVSQPRQLPPLTGKRTTMSESVETPEIHVIQQQGIPENPMAKLLWDGGGSTDNKAENSQ